MRVSGYTHVLSAEGSSVVRRRTVPRLFDGVGAVGGVTAGAFVTTETNRNDREKKRAVNSIREKALCAPWVPVTHGFCRVRTVFFIRFECSESNDGFPPKTRGGLPSAVS